MARRRRLVALAALALLATACGGHGHRARAITPAVAPPRLQASHPCPREPGFACASLTVPLDYARQAAGTLRLGGRPPAGERGSARRVDLPDRRPGAARRALAQARAAASRRRPGRLPAGHARPARAPGPGRCAARRCRPRPAARISSCPPRAVAGVRAGHRARPAVTSPRPRRWPTSNACAGPGRRWHHARRRFLRHLCGRALRADIPDRVARLVLDSVVPQGGVDATYLAAIQATARVLREVCARSHCGWDPARDLQRVVRRRQRRARASRCPGGRERRRSRLRRRAGPAARGRGGPRCRARSLSERGAAAARRPAACSARAFTRARCAWTCAALEARAPVRTARRAALSAAGRGLPAAAVFSL